MSYKTMDLVDTKISSWSRAATEDPDYILMGLKSYDALCKEAAVLDRKKNPNLISKYRGCKVIVIPCIDIMVEIGVTGEGALHLLSKNLFKEANA